MKLLNFNATHLSAKPSTKLVWKAAIMQISAKSGIWSRLANHSAETLLSSYTAYCFTISHVQVHEANK